MAGIFQRRFGIGLDVKLAAAEEVAISDRLSARRMNDAVGHSQVLGVNAKSRRRHFEQRLARRRSRLANLHAAADNAGAAATDYMQLFGLVTFAFMWARMAKVAQDKIAGGNATPYLTTKLVTGRFFMERMLPETTVHLARIQTGSATTMELAAEAF